MTSRRPVATPVVVVLAAAGAVSALVANTLAQAVDGFWAHAAVMLVVGVAVGLVTGSALVLVARSRASRPLRDPARTGLRRHPSARLVRQAMWGYGVGIALMVITWTIAFTVRTWWSYVLVAVSALVFFWLVRRGLRLALTASRGSRDDAGGTRP